MIIIQFSTKPLPFAWLIRKATWSRFSHVDLVLPDGRLIGARGMGGVAVRNPDKYSRVARYRVDAPDDVLRAACSQIGKPYDWGAIFGFIFRRNWQDKQRWFCSELIAWAFEEAGHPLINGRDFYKVSPRDLLLSPYLERLN